MVDNGKLLALDFGGTKLSAATMAAKDMVGDRNGPPGALVGRRVPSPRAPTAVTDWDLMLALARDLLQGKTPAAIGVSFGGPVEAAQGRVVLSHHVPGWEGIPLAERLQAELQAPVWMDNDANVAALGEWRFGAGQGRDSLLYVTVSTGVGGGWVLNGRIWHGADGLAGEIGHMVVQPDGPACVCGKRGCVEALAAGPNLARRAREYLAVDQAAGRILRERVQGDVGAVTAEQVAAAANAGDELAQQVLAGAAHALGLGLGTAITLMNPERVILGGGVTKAGERYWQQVRETARTQALPEMRVEIVAAALGDEAPLWGALALAHAGLQAAAA
jgi:glucokinase